MKKITRFLKEIQPNKHWANNLLISSLSAGIINCFLHKILTPLLFGGRSFSGRSEIFQVLIYLTNWLFLAVALFIIMYALQNLFHIPLRFDPIINFSSNHRLFLVVLLIGGAISLIFFFNNVFGFLYFTSWKMIFNDPFPLVNPVGIDMRTGIYADPKMILEGQNIYEEMHSNYPPFSNIFFLPLQLLNENAAYVVMVFVLLFSNIATLVLTIILVRDFILTKMNIDQIKVNFLSLFLFFSILFYTLSSYGFIFSIERGNYDSIAFLFAMLSIYFLLKKPDSIWLQVIMLGIATHLKIYPAALYFVLLVKHGKKIIFPTILVNLILLASLGFRNAYLFIDVLIHYTLTPMTWIGNHSGYSFASILYDANPELAASLPSLRWILSFIPIIIWLITSGIAIKYLKDKIRILYLTMVAAPLMCLLPTVSHDYKLIILSAPLIIFIAVLVYKLLVSSKLWDYAHLIIVLLCAWLIGRSYTLYPNKSLFINNKYSIILVFAILMIPAIFTLGDLQKQNPKPLF